MTEIKHPRRILALGAPESGVVHLLKEVTGSAPAVTSDTTAGLSHSWNISTRYYTANLPIWIDEIHSISEWRTEFTKPEAKEVISVLGAWIYCFRKPVKQEDVSAVKETMQAIAAAVEEATGYSDAVLLAVAMPQSATPYLDLGADEWTDICLESGFEFVDGEAKGRNEFGEPVGFERVKEALTAHDWDGGEADTGLEDDEDPFNETFDAEELEMGTELFGMKDALMGGGEGDEEQQVNELERMMRRMQAIKEMGESMPEAERKRFAAKAVNDLMKNL